MECTEAPVVTTYMLRNIPENVTQPTLLQELDLSGFSGLYDFCYLPVKCMKTGRGSGFAFVNFLTSSIAADFHGIWHNARRFGMVPSDRCLDVSPASRQGKDANLSSIDNVRMRRLRNSN